MVTILRKRNDMKKGFIYLALVILSVSLVFSADTNKKLAAAKVKSLKGEIINTSTFNNNGKPIVINFWATWCKPCLEELNTINDLYAEWQEKTGVKIIAISLDDSRSSKKVAPYIKAQGWGYEVYLDENSDFKRAMGVNNPPHTFVLNSKGEIVWEHNGFAPGDEKKLFEVIKKVAETDKAE